jgi:hypothetical protein
MSGSVTGGKQAAKTNKELYGDDFYANIGKIGGKNFNPQKPKGFAYAKLHYSPDHPAHPATAGNVGGLKSKRPSASE